MLAEQIKSKCHELYQDWIFEQPRVGFGGENFTIYKLRTMRYGADQDYPDHLLHGGDKSGSDNRIEPSRKWLRSSGVDELPQIWNILQGDMSLVGPRPINTRRFSQYSEKEKDRITRVMPGVFGSYAMKHLDRRNRDLRQLEQIFLVIQRIKQCDPVEYLGFQAWTIWHSMKEVVAGRHL